MTAKSYTTVYSTEKPACRKCGRVECVCHRAKPQGRGPVRVGRETKGRKGAGVTVVTGLGLPETELRNLLSDCKKRLGCGGTLRDGILEFQGEHRDVLVAFLAQRGIIAKKSGG
ncbi:MAG: translation initiation factor [Desulfomicrobium sp.]